ncbi:uncharacterized protein LOC135816651 isoform X1 [Sycon ciliatum]|uniref:uncharacterized protein LOC135816651 isoform X1 n=1 Tax=Sycon ciliatum TaxID=27933 RepID=UPI0031F668DC
MDYDPATPIYVAVRNSLLHTDWRPASSRIWPQSALGTPIGLPDLLHLRHRQCTAHPPRPGLHLLTRRSICKMEPGNWKTTKRKRGNPAAMAGMTELTGRSASKTKKKKPLNPAAMAGMLRSREEALFLRSKKDGTMCRTVRVALNWSDEAAIAHTVWALPYGNSEVLLQYRYITP